MLAVLTGAVLVLAAGVGLYASGILRAPGQTPPVGSLKAEAVTPAQSLQVQGKTPPPALQKEGEAPAVMPQEIFDWLEHLRRTEQQKREISEQQVAELIATIPSLGIGITSPKDVQRLTDPDGDLSRSPHNDLFQDITVRMRQRWQDLVTQFRSYPPPAEVADIATAYDNGLNGTVESISALGELIGGMDLTRTDAADDMRRRQADANRIKSNHTGDVDANFRLTNDLVRRICATYNKEPWFSIDATGPTSGLLSGGLGGLGGGLKGGLGAP